VLAQLLESACDHVALGGVGELLLRLGQVDPACLLDLVVVICGVALQVGEEVEVDGL
jgi:hypothetical protein